MERSRRMICGDGRPSAEAPAETFSPGSCLNSNPNPRCVKEEKDGSETSLRLSV